MSERVLNYKINCEDNNSIVRDIMKCKLHMSSREISHAKAFADGIMVNGEHATVRRVLAAGDFVRIVIHENLDSASEIIPCKGTLDIVYEDEDIICINKPPGMVVHPSHGHFTDSLSNILAYHFQNSGEEHVIRAIGRLDRETSGLILFGKNRTAAANISEQGRNLLRTKEYLALCSGIFDVSEGIVDLPIADDPDVRMVRIISPDGAAALTHFHVLKQFNDYALVKLRLETGRTHQIRVHMKAIGHPLLGDQLYGEDEISSPENYIMTRCALHSSHMEFVHPFSGVRLSFTSKLPEDMRRFVI